MITIIAQFYRGVLAGKLKCNTVQIQKDVKRLNRFLPVSHKLTGKQD
jgi:hypothetical protein